VNQSGQNTDSCSERGDRIAPKNAGRDRRGFPYLEQSGKTHQIDVVAGEILIRTLLSKTGNRDIDHPGINVLDSVIIHP